jgi:nicotinic acid mononucleotide adenylyltransferase
MISFIQYLFESKENTVVLTYGRFNPPHGGHAKMIDHVLAQKGHHHIVVSHSQDSKKNPLHAHEKIDLLHKMYPDHKDAFHAATKEEPTIFHHAKKLHDAGYKHLHVVVGSDRVEEFKKSLNKYNGKDYHFKSIKVSSAGDRDPDAEGTEGMSASKMRHHAQTGNTEEFKKGLHPALHGEADSLMRKIRERTK